MATGRPAKPAALKIIEGRGNGRDSGGRRIKTPPAFRRLPPDPPQWLTPPALEVWTRVLPELERLDLTKELDADALAAYCETVALFAAATEAVRAEGLTTSRTTSDGAEIISTNPNITTMLKAGAQVRAWCSEFGLTPSAELKLATNSNDAPRDINNPFETAPRL